jgi:hypothetical protein
VLGSCGGACGGCDSLDRKMGTSESLFSMSMILCVDTLVGIVSREASMMPFGSD